MRRPLDSRSALLATLLSAACYVAPWGPPDPRPDRAAPVPPPAAQLAGRCEPEESARPTCDLGERWSPAPRGAWEACSRPT